MIGERVERNVVEWVGLGMENGCDIQLVATDCRCGVQVDSM